MKQMTVSIRPTVKGRRLQIKTPEFQAKLGGLVCGRLLLVRPTFPLLTVPALMRGDAALMCLLIRRAETLPIRLRCLQMSPRCSEQRDTRAR